MTREPCSCALCESPNLPSICSHCVNAGLRDYRTALKSLKSFRDSLCSKLSNVLAKKTKSDEQIDWRERKNEKLKTLKGRLDLLNKGVREGKAKIDEASKNLRLKKELLNLAIATLEKNKAEVLGKHNSDIIRSHESALMGITSERLRKQAVVVKHISEIFPLHRMNSNEEKDGLHGPYDAICNVRLPRGIDTCSVPSNDLAASLGYMIQLLNLLVPSLAAPALHNAGFASSRSCIWQRDSYWDAQPSSRSKEYRLFIPQSGENSSWSDRSTSNLDFSFFKPVRRPHIATKQSDSFRSSASMDTDRELQKGISLLKKSVACITAYCCNALRIHIPPDVSTFEAFTKLLAILSSPEELQSLRKTLKKNSRPDKQALQLDESSWKVNSRLSSVIFADSTLTCMPSTHDGTNRHSLKYSEVKKVDKSKNPDEDWAFVEHPALLPPL